MSSLQALNNLFTRHMLAKHLNINIKTVSLIEHPISLFELIYFCCHISRGSFVLNIYM